MPRKKKTETATDPVTPAGVKLDELPKAEPEEKPDPFVEPDPPPAEPEPEPEPASEPEPEKPGPTIRSTEKAGHYRAGRFWSPKAIPLPADLSEDELVVLKADPRIAIEG
jgi:hypothetical protein